MKKVLLLLSAVLVVILTAIPVLAEFPLEDLTLPEEGLHFGFNGDAKDDSGAVVGELVGDPTFVEGRDGAANGAVYLDDNEQYIFLGKYVDADSYTASFWAKVEDNTEHVFLCSSILGSIRIIHDGGVVVGSTINGVADNLSDYAAPRNEWVNLTFVYANETMDIYANGENVGTLSGALPLPLTLIGNEASEQKGWQSYPFLTLDDAWFFPRAFTADEVKAFYENSAAGTTAAADDGLITFKTNTEKEQDYIYFEMNSNFSGDSRYHDGAGFIIYEFPCPPDAKNASLTWKIQAQYQVSVTNTDPDDDDAFEIIDENQPTQGEIDSGKADWGYTNGVQIPTYDLSKWCENNQNGKIWVKMADADPSNGWGGFIFNDFPITYYAGAGPAPEIEKPKTTSELQEEALARIGTDGQSFVVHTETEKPYIIDEYNCGNDNGARFMDGMAYVVYEFTVNPGDTYAGIEWVLNNQYLIEVNNTDPDDESAWETFIEAEQNDDEMENGNPDWGNRRFIMTPDLDKEDENYETSLYIYRYDLSGWCENNSTGKIWIRMGDADPDTGGWGGYISGLYPVTFKSGTEPITWAASGYPVWGTDIVETISEEQSAAAPTYPASGADGSIINGTVIGNETGWGGNADAGAAAAFDGNPATFFDPLGVGDGFCGIDAGESYILDKVVILSRADWNARFPGAMIQGSNDGENWTTLWTSDVEGTNPDYYTVTEFENNTGYSQFRYFNETNHGDVAEVEFYGKPGKVEEVVLPGFETADEAVASIGKTAIVGYEFTSGSEGAFGGEGPENLWDGDTGTKLCTNTLPASSAAKLDDTYSIDGVVIALANDNAAYGRIPTAWTLSGSTDGENWTEITSGDNTMFVQENGDFRYFAKSFDASPAYSYVKIDIASSTDEIVQISEVILTGAKAAVPVDQALDQKAEAPNTFDFGIIAAVASVISLGGFALTKKKH